MSLWSSNSTSTAAKPKFLNATGAYYNAAQCEGVTVATAHGAPGILTAGWTQIWSKPGGVLSVAVTAGGTGYANGGAVTFTDNTSSNEKGAVGTLQTNSTGGIVTVTVTAAGTGYTSSTTATGATGTGAVLVVTTSARQDFEPLVAMHSLT